MLNEVFAHAKPLTVYLQKTNIDLADAMDMADSLIKLLEEMRVNVMAKFSELFTSAQKIAAEIQTEIRIPRIAKTQLYRANYQSTDPEEYYRISVFIPFIDHFVNQLKARFLKHKGILTKIQNVLPNKIVNLDEIEINETIDQMLLLWPDIPVDETVTETDVKKEALFWKQRCEKAQEKSKSFIEALNFCPKSAFPNMHKILKIGAVIPVTSAEAERSFSTLKR